jgi:hypothetical protein
MRSMCQGPGVQVVAKVPVAGPVPPPSMVVTPEASASSICCGQMKWMWLSMPPAVTMWPSQLMISVPAPMTMSTPGCVSGLPALPMATMRPSLQADVGLDDAPVVDDECIGQHRVDRALGACALALRHAVADGLAAAELDLFAVAARGQGEVLFDLDQQAGVGQAHAVADGGAEHVGIGAFGDAGHGFNKWGRVCAAAVFTGNRCSQRYLLCACCAAGRWSNPCTSVWMSKSAA